jgi:hypothetical protein
MGHDWEADSKGSSEQIAGVHSVSWQHQIKMAYGSMLRSGSEGIKHRMPKEV